MEILRATEADHTRLTEIAFAAKRHWNYPEEYYAVWWDELTITPEYIAQHEVYLAANEKTIAGFYSIIVCEHEPFLDHIFIDPAYHHQGIGSMLIQHAIKMQQAKGIKRIKVYVDPYASRFYDKIGARQIDIVPSNIKGRNIPIYQLEL